MLAECGIKQDFDNQIIINLEITNKCNLRCVFCRAEANRHLEHELTKDEIIELFKDFKKMNVKHISITGGEPLARKDLREIISIGIEMGFEFSMATNGTLLKNMPIDFLRNIQKIRISLDASNSSIHNEIRRRENAFDQTIEGIKYLVLNNIFPVLRFTITRKNMYNFHEFIKLAQELGVREVKINRVIPVLGSEFGPECKLSPSEYKEFLESAIASAKHNKIELSSEDPITFKVFKKDINNCQFGGCAAGIVHIHINSRGDVFPCQYLPIKIGSIRENRVYDLIKQKDLSNFFMNIRENLQGKCGKCSYKMICGGCRAAAFSIDENLCGQDPMCFE